MERVVQVVGLVALKKATSEFSSPATPLLHVENKVSKKKNHTSQAPRLSLNGRVERATN